jgi:hypothetical protein
MSIPFFRRRSARLRQLVLPFVVRRIRREQQFKRAILVTTGLAVVAIFMAREVLPRGSPGLPEAHAIRRDGPRAWAAPVGKLQLDPAPLVEGLRAR